MDNYEIGLILITVAFLLAVLLLAFYIFNKLVKREVSSVKNQELTQENYSGIKINSMESVHFSVYQSIKLGFGFGVGFFLSGVFIALLFGSLIVQLVLRHLI